MAENLVVNDVTYPEVEAISMTNEAGEKVAFYPDAVRYNPQTLTEAQKDQARTNMGAASAEDVSSISAEIGNLQGGTVPDYWEPEIERVVDFVKSIQDEGGSDCFSYVVIADIHYESNLGKRSPLIAKRIMDECGIKYCLCLGDMQTRHGARRGSGYISNEWIEIEKMLSPIRDRLLVTQGNHDGSYGWYDLNNDGLVNDDANADGVVDDKDKDVFNYTPQMLHERIFRKVKVIDNVHFSEDGRGYYVDDCGNRVRYIILNSHVNKWEQTGDDLPMMKYNNMYNFRFGQAQYDMVIAALKSVPSDSWSVIMASHVPLDRSGEYTAWGGTEDENGAQTGDPADCVVMMRMLNAYANRTTYSGTFAGTQGGGPAYTNRAIKSEAEGWEIGKTTGSSATSANSARDVTNFIGDGKPLKGRTVYFKDVCPQNTRIMLYKSDKTLIAAPYAKDTGSAGYVGFDATLTEGYIDFSTISSTYAEACYMRIAVATGATNPIITVGEEIVESASAFDDVSVNVDFSEAKGTLVSYHGGHVHQNKVWDKNYSYNGAERSAFLIVATRCDGHEENGEKPPRYEGAVSEQAFDVFTVNKKTKKLYRTGVGYEGPADGPWSY